MRSQSDLDAYRVLGLEPGVSAEEIRLAYRDMARQYHPDHAPDGKRAEYEEKMKRLNAAYEQLKNNETRAGQARLHLQQPDTIWTPNLSSSTAQDTAHDPYEQFRSHYRRRVWKLEVMNQNMPQWARMLSGLFASAGLVAGFVIGLPFGGVGCFPGALIGFLVGALVGVSAVYLGIALAPALIAGGLGYWAGGQTGLTAGIFLGLFAGVWALRRFLRKNQT